MDDFVNMGIQPVHGAATSNMPGSGSCRTNGGRSQAQAGAVPQHDIQGLEISSVSSIRH